MPNRTLATLLFLIWGALTPFAYADDHDGHWWNALNRGEKLTYVVGFFDGTNYGKKIFDASSVIAIADPKTGKFSATRAEVAKAVVFKAIGIIERTVKNVTAGQLVEGLDQTYSDYRNRGISVTHGIVVVADGIKGATEQEVTRRLEEMRRAASQ